MERDPAFVKGGPPPPERDPASVKGGPPPPERDPASVKGGPPPPERDPASVKGGPPPTPPPAPAPTPTPAPAPRPAAPRPAPAPAPRVAPPPRSFPVDPAPQAPQPGELAAMSDHIPSRLAVLVGPALLVLGVHASLDREEGLALALVGSSHVASVVSAGLLARRLRRCWPWWALISWPLLGIPGLILATLPTLEAPGKEK